MTLPQALYTAAQVREFDQRAIAAGIPGFELMRRAAQVSLNAIVQRWPDTGRLVIFAGRGNNGGDGFLLAALAREQGLKALVFHCGIPDAAKEDANKALRLAQARGAALREFEAASVHELLAETPAAGTVLVDALLGTGSRGVLTPTIRQAIECINGAGLPVAALDLPSGLSSDSGDVSEAGDAVCAHLTITFIALKQGLFTGRGPALCGDLIFHDLGLEDLSVQPVTTNTLRADIKTTGTLFKRRPRDAHKGDFGNVIVIGGDTGLGGAALMSAEAAVCSGAGTVCLLTRPEHVTAALCRRPEIMVRGVQSVKAEVQSLQALFLRADVIVIGPGLGKSGWSREMLQLALQYGNKNRPVVMDADALNLLAERAGERAEERAGEKTGGTGAEQAGLRREHWVLTPHPGEAARLLNASVMDIQADRFAAVRSLQHDFGGCCVLKGAGSLLAFVDGETLQIRVCTEGNPGMASGGMGDVLSGIIGALLAQFLPLGYSPGQITAAAVCVHGECADLAVQDGGRQTERGLLATALLPLIRTVINR
ncbi:MAG: NAD(P)H-hydrate dehydratase [Pseudomonadales bacterium]|nr:NAD(P)H-hydrate dehydratase [Pseudomonadales bacterium]